MRIAETVVWGDTEIVLTGEYSPGTPPVFMMRPEDCDPGEAAQFAVETATIGGVDVLDMLDKSYTFDEESLLTELARQALTKLQEAEYE